MKKYEIMVILDKDTSDKKETIGKLLDILKTNKGKIVESDEWGLKKFAYPINKKTEGFYFVYIVETNTENILEFERICKIDKNVVRTMVVNTENEKNYIQNTKLSKTDLSKMKDDKRDKKERNFNKYKKYTDSNIFNNEASENTSKIEKEDNNEGTN